MAGRFCVSITHCREDHERATVGFVMANAAVGSEKETLVFLSTDGVWCAVRDEVDRITAGAPFPPLRELVEGFLETGGRIVVCAPCMQRRGITEDRLFEGVQVAGGAALIEWLSGGSPCAVY